MCDSNVIPLYLLPRGARPREHIRLSFEEVKALRLIDCPAYAGCLAFAAHLNWSGFHCVSCKAFREHHTEHATKYGLQLPIFEEPRVALEARRP